MSYSLFLNLVSYCFVISLLENVTRQHSLFTWGFKNIVAPVSHTILYVKGIVQPFELGPVTSLVRSAVKFCMAGHFQKKFLMIQSHERSLKPISAA
jgi:hypothetical protein